jgi:hypothetical protein
LVSSLGEASVGDGGKIAAWSITIDPVSRLETDVLFGTLSTCFEDKGESLWKNSPSEITDRPIPEPTTNADLFIQFLLGRIPD